MEEGEDTAVKRRKGSEKKPKRINGEKIKRGLRGVMREGGRTKRTRRRELCHVLTHSRQ